MKKLLLASLMMLACLALSAETTFKPVSTKQYYQSAKGKKGIELRKALHNIIKGHKVYPYSMYNDPTALDVSRMIKQLDLDPDNEQNLILLYSGRSQDKEYQDKGRKNNYKKFGGTIKDSWNREHVWVKSHGFPNRQDTAFTDIHHLRPADRTINTDRGARDFDWGGLPHDEAIGCFSDYDSWEPRDEVKGDIARMLLYMDVRYEADGKYDLVLEDRTGTYGPRLGKLSVLLEWNRLDPPSKVEKKRNQMIYEKFQHNRNPFVDHPEYAELIWGKPKKTPTLNIFIPQMKFDPVKIGETSEPKVYVVSGYYLKKKVVVEVEEGFQLSLKKDKAYTNKLKLKTKKGFINQQIYIRMKPKTIKAYHTKLTISSKKAAKKTVELTGRGVDPSTKVLLQDGFHNNNNNWQFVDLGGKGNWRLGSFGKRDFMKISGSRSKNACHDWLISPAINIENYRDIVLTFESAMNRKDVIKPMDVKISYDYDGQGNPDKATWFSLEAEFSKGHYRWKSSGYLPIDHTKGKRLYIAFEYKSSSRKKSTSWEIDDVLLTATPIR